MVDATGDVVIPGLLVINDSPTLAYEVVCRLRCDWDYAEDFSGLHPPREDLRRHNAVFDAPCGFGGNPSGQIQRAAVTRPGGASREPLFDHFSRLIAPAHADGGRR